MKGVVGSAIFDVDAVAERQLVVAAARVAARTGNWLEQATTTWPVPFRHFSSSSGREYRSTEPGRLAAD